MATITTNTTTRIATQADVPALQRFFQKQGRRDNILGRDGSFMRWQYGRLISGQLKDSLSLVIAEEDAQIAGILGFIPCQMRLADGQIVHGVWLSQWLVLEEYRGTGVGLQLFERLREFKFDVIAMQGVRQNMQGLLIKLGFALIEDQTRYICITNPHSTVRLLFDAGIKAKLNDLIPFAPKLGERPNYKIAPWCKAFDEQLSTCIETFGQLHGGTVRDLDYLKWRYQEHPRFTYRTLVAVDGLHVIGLAVYRIERVKDRRERIMRILEVMARGQAAYDLTNAMINIARAEGVCFVDFHSYSKPEPGILEVGLRPLDPASPMADLPARFQPLAPGYRPLTAAVLCKYGTENLVSTSLYLTRSDGDVDRP